MYCSLLPQLQYWRQEVSIKIRKTASPPVAAIAADAMAAAIDKTCRDGKKPDIFRLEYVRFLCYDSIFESGMYFLNIFSSISGFTGLAI